jgi:putative oxidoreductase
MDIKAILKPSPARYDLALAIIRVVVGVVFFMHGWQKFFTMGMEGVGGFFGSLGVPAAGLMAVVVSLVELLGGLALILGVGTRIAAILLAADMFVAFLLVHVANGFFVSEGGYELVLLLFAGAVGLALSGAGSLSVDNNLA